MNLKTIAIASAVGSLLALGGATASAGDAAAKEKCSGVAAAGQNDCATSSHSCAGQAKADKDAERVEVRAERRVREDGRQGRRA